MKARLPRLLLGLTATPERSDGQPIDHYFDRRPQTLRAWACMENGPLRPRRLMGRLLWDMADIRRLLGVAA